MMHASDQYPGSGGAQPVYGEQPGGSGEPRYGQPFPPHASNRLLIVLVSAAAVLLLVVGGLGVLYVRGGFGGDDGAASPTGAVEKYLQASRTRDWNTARTVVCDARQSEVETLVEFTGDTNGASWTITSDRAIGGDKHEVVALIKLALSTGSLRAEQKLSATFQVIDERGWKICHVTGQLVS